MYASYKWAAKWRSKNKSDGYTEHFLSYPTGNMIPMLFKTRRETREWIKRWHGEIARRPDLQAEPFGWMPPVAVRVHVAIDEVKP